MPDPDDQKTASPETGSSGTHPALESMTEAVRLTSYAAAFLSPTRPFDEPSLEEDDWPEDLDGPETLQMLTHLGDIADYASVCINGIRCQHKIAEEAKPELDEIEQLHIDGKHEPGHVLIGHANAHPKGMPFHLVAHPHRKK